MAVRTLSGGPVEDPDLGVAKRTTALASPPNYLEISFNAQAGVPYRVCTWSFSQTRPIPGTTPASTPGT